MGLNRTVFKQQPNKVNMHTCPKSQVNVCPWALLRLIVWIRFVDINTIYCTYVSFWSASRKNKVIAPSCATRPGIWQLPEKAKADNLNDFFTQQKQKYLFPVKFLSLPAVKTGKILSEFTITRSQVGCSTQTQSCQSSGQWRHSDSSAFISAWLSYGLRVFFLLIIFKKRAASVAQWVVGVVAFRAKGRGAFDCVWHADLLEKLHSLSVRGHALDLGNFLFHEQNANV